MNSIDERWKAIFSSIGVIIINVAALLGIDLGDGASIQNVLLGLAWIASICWALWKNHNFTHEAIESQKVLDAMKSIRKETGEQVNVNMALELTGGADHDNE